MLVGNLVVLLVAVVLFGSIPAGPVIGVGQILQQVYYKMEPVFSGQSGS